MVHHVCGIQSKNTTFLPDVLHEVGCIQSLIWQTTNQCTRCCGMLSSRYREQDVWHELAINTTWANCSHICQTPSQMPDVLRTNNFASSQQPMSDLDYMFITPTYLLANPGVACLTWNCSSHKCTFCADQQLCFITTIYLLEQPWCGIIPGVASCLTWNCSSQQCTFCLTWNCSSQQSTFWSNPGVASSLVWHHV